MGDKQKKKVSDEARVDLEIQLYILKLYHMEPKLALFGTDPKIVIEDNKNLIIGFTFCLQDFSLRNEAMKAILAVHQPEFIDQVFLFFSFDFLNNSNKKIIYKVGT